MTTTTTDVTGQDVLKEVRRLAEEQRDFIYCNAEGSLVCNYVERDGTPGCIFGHALTKLLPDVKLIEGIKASELFKELGLRLTANEAAWADMVQFEQDRSQTWGDAVFTADGHYPGVAA